MFLIKFFGHPLYKVLVVLFLSEKKAKGSQEEAPMIYCPLGLKIECSKLIYRLNTDCFFAIQGVGGTIHKTEKSKGIPGRSTYVFGHQLLSIHGVGGTILELEKSKGIPGEST